MPSSILSVTPNPVAPGLTSMGAQETAPQGLTRVPSPAAGELPLIEAPEIPSGPNALAGVGRVPASFSQILDGFLQQVDSAQHHADDMVESLALGEPVDVHQVMLALNEASNAMQLTLQVRGKILDAYQEFMRMPF